MRSRPTTATPQPPTRSSGTARRTRSATARPRGTRARWASGPSTRRSTPWATSIATDIPFQFALAEAFTLCDAYHCSITTGTDPNRITFWSGSNFNPALRAQGINCTTNDSEPNNNRCWPNPSAWVAGQPQPQPTYRYVGSDFNWDTLPDLLQRARRQLAHLPGHERQLDRRDARLPGVLKLPSRAAGRSQLRARPDGWFGLSRQVESRT